MNVLLVNQFFPPDLAPTGVVLRDLAEVLAGRGHSVTVLCSRHSYAGSAAGAVSQSDVNVVRVGGVAVARRGFGGTLFRYLVFHVAAFRWARRLAPAPDVVVSMTTPPLIGLTLQGAVRGGSTAHINWLMDLYPHVLVAHGLIRDGGWPHRVLRNLTRRQWNASSLIVALGDGMARQGMVSGGNQLKSRVETVLLWVSSGLQPWSEGQVNPIRARRGWGDDETVFLYSGNVGLGHAITPFLDAARRLTSTPCLRWVFTGEGRRLGEVVDFVAGHPAVRVECLPYADAADLRAHLCSADIHLVSLQDSWSGLIMPSKLQAAFAVGRPVLFVGPPDSDPARWIRESGGGWVISADDGDGLVRAVLEGLDPVERRRRGAAAYRFAREHFNEDANCTRLAELIENAAGMKET